MNIGKFFTGAAAAATLLAGHSQSFAAAAEGATAQGPVVSVQQNAQPLPRQSSSAGLDLDGFTLISLKPECKNHSLLVRMIFRESPSGDAPLLNVTMKWSEIKGEYKGYYRAFNANGSEIAPSDEEEKTLRKIGIDLGWFFISQSYTTVPLPDVPKQLRGLAEMGRSSGCFL